MFRVWKDSEEGIAGGKLGIDMIKLYAYTKFRKTKLKGILKCFNIQK